MFVPLLGNSRLTGKLGKPQIDLEIQQQNFNYNDITPFSST